MRKDSVEYAEFIRKQRESHLGKRASKETRIILAQRLKERNDPRLGFKKGQSPWNKCIFDNQKEWMKRFNSKYIILKNGCWEWQDTISSITGYGRIWKNGKNVMAHRFSYEFFNGPIPEKMTIDHLCKNRKCVNPFHLDLVTRHENASRGGNEIANNKLKTHCPSGHEYNRNNTYLTKKGYRQCISCHTKRWKHQNLQQKIARRLSNWP